MVVEVEGGVGIVIGRQGHFFANLARDVHVDIHVEIEAAHGALPLREDGVFHPGDIHPKDEVDIALRPDVHLSTSEEAVQEIVFDIDFGDGIQGAHPFASTNAGQLVEVVAFFLFLALIEVFFKGHVAGRAEEVVANALGDEVLPSDRIVFNAFINAAGVVQVNKVGIGVGEKIAVAVLDIRDGIWRFRHQSHRFREGRRVVWQRGGLFHSGGAFICAGEGCAMLFDGSAGRCQRAFVPGAVVHRAEGKSCYPEKKARR